MASRLVEKWSKAVDERVNLKHVHRQLQALAKVLIVTTFVEDALRVLLTFSVQQNSMRIAGWQSPVLHTGLPVFSFVVQMCGALMVGLPGGTGTGPRAQAGVVTLLFWCCVHPIMYRQETNWEFVLETLTIMGGLLVLLSHCLLVEAAAAARAAPPGGTGDKLPRIVPAKAVGPSMQLEGPAAARAHGIQAVGRMLIVSVFLYYAINKADSYAHRVGTKGAMQNYDWATPVLELLMIVGLLGMCALVIIGIKSRGVALLLALLMAISGCWMHPFWIYLFSSKHYKMEGVSHMEGAEVDAFTMGDHQRYFFFQTMSTVGALLLLVVHGPGKLSMDEQQGQLVLITSHDA